VPQHSLPFLQPFCSPVSLLLCHAPQAACCATATLPALLLLPAASCLQRLLTPCYCVGDMGGARYRGMTPSAARRAAACVSPASLMTIACGAAYACRHAQRGAQPRYLPARRRAGHGGSSSGFGLNRENCVTYGDVTRWRVRLARHMRLLRLSRQCRRAVHPVATTIQRGDKVGMAVAAGGACALRRHFCGRTRDMGTGWRSRLRLECIFCTGLLLPSSLISASLPCYLLPGLLSTAAAYGRGACWPRALAFRYMPLALLSSGVTAWW